MKPFFRFLRTTLAGGILFLLPLIVFIIIGGKAVAIAHDIIAPLASRIPVKSIIGLKTPLILAVVLIVLCCFMAGVFARLRFARHSVDWLESNLLSNLPGYVFIKAFSRDLLSSSDGPDSIAVLVQSDDSSQIGFLVEQLDNGYVAVFIPGAPNPQSGDVLLVSNERLTRLDIPARAVIKSLKNYGKGANDLVASQTSSGPFKREG